MHYACRYVAIQVNLPSCISQAVAIAVNRTKGVNWVMDFTIDLFQQLYIKFVLCKALINYILLFSLSIP